MARGYGQYNDMQKDVYLQLTLIAPINPSG